MNSQAMSFRQACAHMALIGLFLALAAAPLEAALTGAVKPPSVMVTADGQDGSYQYTPTFNELDRIPDEGQHYALDSEKSTPGALFGVADITIKELEFNPDPFVLNNILVTNNTGSTQTFTVQVTLPTVFGGPNIISGNVLTTVIDGGGSSGATLSSVGVPIYQAQIDGATVATLQSHPFSVVAPPAASNFAPASFGPSVNLVGVTTDIGILLRFSVTAGDTASILSRFDVEAIPEPSTLALGGMALAAAIAVARKRRSH